MSQTDQFDRARQIAIRILRPYVERGDSDERLRQSSMGGARQEFWYQVGNGPVWGQPRAKFGSDTIRVFRLAGDQDRCYQFRLSEIASEIRQGVTQMVMPL